MNNDESKHKVRTSFFENYQPRKPNYNPPRSRGGNRLPYKQNTRSFSNNRSFGGFSRVANEERSTSENLQLEKELFEEQNEVTKGIDFDQYDSVRVTISGGDAPPPIESFSEIENIHPQLLWNIERSGYTSPTPVQKYTFPIAVKGTDIITVAQTGSGKTAAFLLPMIQMLLETGGGNPCAFYENTDSLAPIGLILTPTRELALQIHAHARKFLYRTGMRAGIVYGGAPLGPQLSALRAGVDLVVATPGRLVDFLDRGAVTLKALRFFVLDEADRMLDMGFERQLHQILDERNGVPQPGVRQTLMFSATFPSEIKGLARQFLDKKHLFVAVGRVGGAANTVRQELVYAESADKTSILLDFFRSVEDASVLVFVERKSSAAWLEGFLCERGVDAISIHGDKEQREREYAMTCFKRGLARVLVATDVASRGLDIPNVAYVVNYGF